MGIQVPTRGPAQTKLGAAPIPENGVRASANAFGANVGQAVVGAGNTVSNSANMLGNIGVERQDKVNVAASVDAYSKFRDEWLPLEVAFKARTGINADKVTVDARKSFDDLRARYMGDMEDDVKLRFEGLTRGMRESKLDSFSVHEQAQTLAAYNENLMAMANLTIEDAVESYGSPSEVAKSKKIIAKATRETMKGSTPEAIELAVQTANTQMHNAVIDKIMVQSPEAAQNYYLRHKDDISEKQQTAIEEKLRIKVEITTAQSFADTALTAQMTYDEAIADARKKYSGTQEETVVKEVKLRFAEKATGESLAEKQANADVWKSVVDGGSKNDLPASVLSKLTPLMHSALDRFEQQRAITGSGYAAITDVATGNKLHNAWMEDPVAFALYELEQDQPNMTESDYHYWQGQQRLLSKADAKDKAKLASYTQSDKLAKEYMNAAGIKYGASANTANAAKAQKVLSLARQVVDDALVDGRKPTRDEMEQALSTLFLTGEVEGSGFFENDDYTFYEVANTGNAAKFYLDDVSSQVPNISKATGVPEESVLDVVRLLKKNGAPITPSNIQKMYQAGLK